MANGLEVFGFLGTALDQGSGPERWERWRPSVSLCQHEELLVDRLVLFCGGDERDQAVRAQVDADIRAVSPETEIVWQSFELEDPWDFEKVFAELHQFTRDYPFREDWEQLVHISTGSHVCQICLFLLTESRHFPARLIQTAPPPRRGRERAGLYSIIDLDLSEYDRIAGRFDVEQKEGASLLKSGIPTRNAAFNQKMEELERVVVNSSAPVLLLGPTGAGKSLLARRIFELKRKRHLVEGDFVEVNCATLRGDQASSALFGHVKGAFTGAVQDRAGLLRSADGGMLFLDEIGELGLDEQAMLLRALEEGRFLPLGSDREVESRFLLIAGTNRDLYQAVREGKFREDLLARIDLWTFELPGLRQRLEDLEPNIDYELDQHLASTGRRVRFGSSALSEYLDFARSPSAEWNGNFRDLNASITRLATLSRGGRITKETVANELERLKRAWSPHRAAPSEPLAKLLLPPAVERELDPFDRVQLELVLTTCLASPSLSDAGRKLFRESRKKKQNPNDADRLSKYLRRFGLRFQDLDSLRRQRTEAAQLG